MRLKRLRRFVNEFAGWYKHTADQLADIVAKMVGRRLRYRDLV